MSKKSDLTWFVTYRARDGYRIEKTRTKEFALYRGQALLGEFTSLKEAKEKASMPRSTEQLELDFGDAK